MEEKKRIDDLKDLKVYSLTELEEIIGVTHRTLQSYVKDGRIQASKIGGKWRVTERDLRTFLDTNGTIDKICSKIFAEILSKAIEEDSDDITISKKDIYASLGAKKAKNTDNGSLEQYLDHLIQMKIDYKNKGMKTTFSPITAYCISDNNVAININPLAREISKKRNAIINLEEMIRS